MIGFIFLFIVISILASILVISLKFLARPVNFSIRLLNRLKRLTRIRRKPTQISQPPVLPGADVGRDDLELMRQLFVAPSPRKGRIKVEAPPPLRVRLVSLVLIFSLLFGSFSPLTASAS